MFFVIFSVLATVLRLWFCIVVRTACKLFLDPTTPIDQIDLVGIEMMRKIYGGGGSVSLSALRYRAYLKQCAKGQIKLQRIPPIEGAALQHGRRGFHQLSEWVQLDVDYTDTPPGWQWVDDGGFTPVYSRALMAPKHLESFVSCNCVKRTCSTNNGSCKNNGVRCIPSVCGHCND